ncbi:hypothetical protein GCM10027091_65950 [Streptomyces daliensis]
MVRGIPNIRVHPRAPVFSLPFARAAPSSRDGLPDGCAASALPVPTGGAGNGGKPRKTALVADGAVLGEKFFEWNPPRRGRLQGIVKLSKLSGIDV